VASNPVEILTPETHSAVACPQPRWWKHHRVRGVRDAGIADYVAGFCLGVLKRVRSPHYIEATVPERVAPELDELVASASR